MPLNLNGPAFRTCKSAALSYYLRDADQVFCRLWRSAWGREGHGLPSSGAAEAAGKCGAQGVSRFSPWRTCGFCQAL